MEVGMYNLYLYDLPPSHHTTSVMRENIEFDYIQSPET